jgi:hypothetical protein
VGFILTIGLVALLAACNQEPLPTPMSLAIVPTIPPAPTFLPPTTDLTAMASAPAAVTAPATVLPAPTFTPAPLRPGIDIGAPDADADLTMGSDIVARGLVQRDPSHTVWLSLITYNGLLLVESQAVVEDLGWRAGLTVPLVVSGAASLTASIRDESGETLAQYQIPVSLVLDTESTDRYLALFRPVSGDSAMAGFNLFFDGRAQRPVNNTVTISVWSDDCMTQVARQSFVLRGSGYWQGFVVIPRTVSGPGCAIAHFGTPGEETWREAQVPVQILANDDENARGITIGNPPGGSTMTAGQEMLVYGTALNASEESVQVSVLLENGRIISQTNTVTDYWGYWELPVLLPVDIEGPAAIIASAGEPGANNYAETQALISIKPAPPSP